jgi:hypothetical protein
MMMYLLYNIVLYDLLHYFIYADMNQGFNMDLKLKPVLFKVLVKDLANINPADHIMIKGQHYLIKSVNVQNGIFSA